MRTYETIVVIDSLLKAEEIDGIIEKIERTIKNNGGKIISTDRWGKKRLAYEIKKRQYGYYVEIVFEAQSNIVNILETDYRLEENILRYLTVHLNKRALEYREQQKLKKADVQPKEAPEEKVVSSETVVKEEVVANEKEEAPVAPEEPESESSVVEPSSEEEKTE